MLAAFQFAPIDKNSPLHQKATQMTRLRNGGLTVVTAQTWTASSWWTQSLQWYWHKSLQFVENSNITLLIYDFYLPFRWLYYAWVLLFDRSPGFALRFPLPHLYHKLVTQSFDTDTSEYLPCIKIFVYVELKKLKYVLPSLIVVSAAAKQLKAGCCFNATEIFSIQTGEQSAMLWE